MSASRIFIVIFVLGIASILVTAIAAIEVEPYSSQAKAKRSINLNQPGVASTFKRFEESAPTLIKLLQAIWEVIFAGLWIVDASLNAFLWVLNVTVSSCTELSVSIFGVLFNVVKLLEAFGFGVKFLLELNYAVLSYMFDTISCIKDNFNHAMTLVKLKIANETEHIYESSTMALEGMQNLFVTAYNQTLVNVQYVSSVVTNNFTAPFGLSALDTSLVASMFVAGFQFFVESMVMTGKVFKDGNMFIFNYAYDVFGRIGRTIMDCIIAVLCFIQHVIAMVIHQIVYIVTWPFYVLASIVSKISCMLYYSWEAFVNWIGYLDSSIREMTYSIFRTIALGITSFVNSITGFINMYFPGGIMGCIVSSCLATILFLWRKEITSLLVSSWMSLRRMNENARAANINIPDDEPEFDNEEEFEVEGMLAAQNTAEPPLDGNVPQHQTKLKYELELEKDKRLCVICQDNVKNILLLPCRHVCMCQQCLLELRLGRVHLVQCPLCRQRIQSTLEVFV